MNQVQSIVRLVLPVNPSACEHRTIFSHSNNVNEVLLGFEKVLKNFSLFLKILKLKNSPSGVPDGLHLSVAVCPSRIEISSLTLGAWPDTTINSDRYFIFSSLNFVFSRLDDDEKALK